MQYEDRLTIATPEGVSLDVTLAGVPSRLAAAAVDGTIQALLVWALLLIAGNIIGDGPQGSDVEAALLWVALINVVVFTILFFYYVLSETLWSGQSPGKRALGLRVVTLAGTPVGFKTSMIRNLLRVVDLLPAVYITGVIAALVSSRNQRVGDIVAGTIVIRERTAAPLETASHTGPVGPPPGTETWDVSGITGQEIAAVRSFLERRHSLTPEARARLAGEMESKLRPRVPGAPEWAGYPEVFLEHLAAVKSARS